MWFTRVSIANPVLATMVMLAFVVLGLFSYQRLKVDQFPDIEFPVVVVQMDYPGASPEIVEAVGTQTIGAPGAREGARADERLSRGSHSRPRRYWSISDVWSTVASAVTSWSCCVMPFGSAFVATCPWLYCRAAASTPRRLRALQPAGRPAAARSTAAGPCPA